MKPLHRLAVCLFVALLTAALAGCQSA